MDTEYRTNYYDKNYPGIILAIQLRRKLNYHLVITSETTRCECVVFFA